jgi:hypothetical protein
VGEIRANREQKAAPSMKGEKYEKKFGISTQYSQFGAPED